MRIKAVKAEEILDSRGNPTLSVCLKVGNNLFFSSLPSGASKGKYEALELRDGGKRYFGQGVLKAINNINKIIAPKIKNLDPTKQEEIDCLMLELDGTKNKSRLGANAILGVSLAVARAGAFAHNLELYQYLGQLFKNKKFVLPSPFMNVINGGKHAGNNLSFQEFIIVPKAKNFSERIRIGSEFYHFLKEIIRKKYGITAINIGDEGGFAPPLNSAEEALGLLEKAKKESGYAKEIDLALDCAASNFFEKGNYFLDKNKRTKLNKEELVDYYLDLIKKYKIISLEDPFQEEDFSSFNHLLKKSKIQIVGDDLTVSNPERIKRAIEEKSCNCLLLKPNQIGTLTEALQAAGLAVKNNWKVMVSHRSGETEDSFIADLAVGLGCGMIKAGAPCRGERVAKYNRLLRIERGFVNIDS